MISRKFAINKILIALIALQVIIDIPFFTGLIYPQHDSLLSFQLFYFTYNEYFIFGELPRWVPYGLYGLQSDYFIMLPTDYIALFIGKILGVKNALSVFKLSLFFSQLIYLFGVYLLAKRLFKEQATVFFVTVVAIASTVFYYQLHFNFLVYIYIPFILYFLHKYFTDFKLRDLIIPGSILILSLLGIGVYLATLPALVISIFSIVMIISRYKKWRSYFAVSKRELAYSGLFFILFIVLTGTFYSFVVNALNHTEGIYIGRDSVTKVSYLDSFLTYASYTIGFRKFLGLIYPTKEFLISGITLHVGILSLLFIVYALVVVRRASFYALTAVVLVFTLFSLGSMTPVAELLYNYFPTMKFYRHIGHSVSNFKLFLPFMAGFGVDHLLTRYGPLEWGDKKWKALSADLARLAIALTVVAGTFTYAKIIGQGQEFLWAGLTALFCLGLFLLKLRFRTTASLGFFIVACVIVNIFSFRVLLDGTFHFAFRNNVPPEVALNVNKYDYQPMRTEWPTEKRSSATLPYISRSTVRYTFAYNFLQWDPCISSYRTDFWNSNVATLFKARGTVSYNLGTLTAGKRISLPKDRNFIFAVGCYAPKLQLRSEVIFSGDLKKSERLIKGTKNIDKVVILNKVSEDIITSWRKAMAGGTTAGDGGTISVTDFRANELSIEADITAPEGRWLYYADAYHPGWKASVNGKESPIAQANIAFKAIRLEKGQSTIKFSFNNAKSTFLMKLLIAFGSIFVILLFALLCLNIFRQPHLACKSDE